jgi:uncharacterized integral membrane protein
MTDPQSLPESPETAEPAPPSSRPRRWLGPALLLLFVVTPVLVLIFSNTESRRVEFAWWEWNAPLWLILVVTFFAGAVITRAATWYFRRRRRRKRTAEGA